MNRMTLIGLGGLVAAAVVCGGCARIVTIEPALVSSRNDADWTIRSAPTAMPPAAGTAANRPASSGR